MTRPGKEAVAARCAKRSRGRNTLKLLERALHVAHRATATGRRVTLATACDRVILTPGANNMKPKSTKDETDGLRYFPRMLDKIRLHAEGNWIPIITSTWAAGPMVA